MYLLIWMFAVHLYIVLILTFKTARNKYDMFEEIPIKMQMFAYIKYSGNYIDRNLL